MAIPSFVGDPQFGPDISGVISNNLRRSGLFNPLPPASYIEQISDFSAAPRGLSPDSAASLRAIRVRVGRAANL